jgi:hypothetical protein
MNTTIDLSFDVTVSEWNGQGIYLAVMTTPLAMNAAGATPEEAVANLKEYLLLRMARFDATPERVAPTALPVAAQNPWVAAIGTWSDRPDMIEEWRKCVEENRQLDDLVQESAVR